MTGLQTEKGVLVTANNLLSGRIVWRDSQGQWVCSIAKAAWIPDGQAEEVLAHSVATAGAKGVVGVYTVAARLVDAPDGRKQAEPVTMRERIRAFGPSVHPDFAYERHGEKEA